MPTAEVSDIARKQDEKGQAQERIRLAASSTSFRQFEKMSVQDRAECQPYARARNPSCGDEIEVSLLVEADLIKNLNARVCGCIVTSAAWTFLAQALLGKKLAEARKLLNLYLAYLETASGDSDLPIPLGELRAFRRPSPRQGCARLPAQAVLKCLGCPTETK